MRQYAKNIELVDPQLRKNEELVKVLKLFEDSWGLGKQFLDDSALLKQFDWFSTVLSAKQAEHAEFKEQIECRDAAIFMSIPSLLVFRAASKDPVAIETCSRFLPDIAGSQGLAEL
jgi:hypothetical protein